MKNKKNLIKLGVISVVVWCLGLSFSSAATLHVSGLTEGIKAVSEKDIANKIIQIHFADNWNNFGGFFYYSNLEDESDSNSTDSFTVGIYGKNWYECKEQLKWFYYNAERWERLRPLDDDTKSSRKNVSEMSWWIYTMCAVSGYDAKLKECESKSDEDVEVCKDKVKDTNSADDNGYYGTVSHTYSGKNMRLVIWVEYSIPGNSNDFIEIYTGTNLYPSFIRIGNKYPVGFIYDYNGWVGLAGCRINGPTESSMRNLINEMRTKPRKIRDMFRENDDPNEKVKYNNWTAETIDCSVISAEDTLSKVVIEWIVWTSDKWTDYETIFTQMGNQSDEKMQYFTTANVDNTTLMNYARKKAEILCRWKWRMNLNTQLTNGGKVVCIDDIDISAAQAEEIKKQNKTLIVKGHEVRIKPMTWAEADKSSTGYYDIFIDNWGNLVIEENDNISGGTNEELFIFTKEWFITGGMYSYSGFNEMVSWWGIHSTDGYSWDEVAVWAFIRGNFIVNWHVKSASSDDKLKHKYFIYWKFSTLDWFNQLENIFSWRCNNQISNEDYKFYCPKFEWNPYANAALVIIDQNYPSTFYNN